MFERGVVGTTLEEVKAAAEVSSSQLYHYFDDKPALRFASCASGVSAGNAPLARQHER